MGQLDTLTQNKAQQVIAPAVATEKTYATLAKVIKNTFKDKLAKTKQTKVNKTPEQ